ncbi:MAG TPA: tRNA pseudouridine(55) synthase TruB [Azospirillaceae bacterium]|nr:tRNA pseudouridine(55) synthase TruB [Azospirillaceae bacterium]
MARRRKGQPVNGWLVLDKPQGLTSTQAMARARRFLDAQKAGHGGTLDPLATGVLPIAFGEATKTVDYVMGSAKTYSFTVRWGEARDTDDAEGQVTATSDVRPGVDAVRAALPRFLGEIDQLPPRYSAIKVDGERAYALARDGVEVDLQPRVVRIDRFELVDVPDADHAAFEVDCGKGTYVRSLARDLAVALGTVGHVTALRRLAVGRFTVDQAISLDELEEEAQTPAVARHLLGIETALDDIPALALSPAEAQRLRQGQAVSLMRRQDAERLKGLRVDLSAERPTILTLCDGQPVALAVVEGGEVRPVRVLNL